MKKISLGILTLILIFFSFLPLQRAKAETDQETRPCTTICITRISPRAFENIRLTYETSIIIDIKLIDAVLDSSSSKVFINSTEKKYSVIKNQLIVSDTGLSGIDNQVVIVEANLVTTSGEKDSRIWVFYVQNSEIPISPENSIDSSPTHFANQTFYTLLTIFSFLIIVSISFLILLFLRKKRKAE
jgi:hypothetical protein